MLYYSKLVFQIKPRVNVQLCWIIIIINFYYKKVSLKLIEEEIQCQPKYCWCFSHPFVDDDWYAASSAALGRASIAVEI